MHAQGYRAINRDTEVLDAVTEGYQESKKEKFISIKLDYNFSSYTISLNNAKEEASVQKKKNTEHILLEEGEAQ
ncbi:hypothetical protein ACJX0J_009065, partial [Zea mays]